MIIQGTKGKNAGKNTKKMIIQGIKDKNTEKMIIPVPRGKNIKTMIILVPRCKSIKTMMIILIIKRKKYQNDYNSSTKE